MSLRAGLALVVLAGCWWPVRLRAPGGGVDGTWVALRGDVAVGWLRVERGAATWGSWADPEGRHGEVVRIADGWEVGDRALLAHDRDTLFDRRGVVLRRVAEAPDAVLGPWTLVRGVERFDLTIERSTPPSLSVTSPWGAAPGYALAGSGSGVDLVLPAHGSAERLALAPDGSGWTGISSGASVLLFRPDHPPPWAPSAVETELDLDALEFFGPPDAQVPHPDWLTDPEALWRALGDLSALVGSIPASANRASLSDVLDEVLAASEARRVNPVHFGSLAAAVEGVLADGIVSDAELVQVRGIVGRVVTPP